ncbi:flagellar type III secretion system protein FlhB [Pseudooceanicola aestuarii]|uniref:flagellar type III secretion system protein FlhB n=1 Tax=Pseudooceanicola aestuarii TaxID=2697319 RepID=UPI0013CFC47A|nr:flagellar type III secretion system protein FlhB [Pseudooceanicola aestuarii]
MAEDEDKSNKTEEPTERRLQKAREKGDVASSKETGNLTSVLSLTLIAGFVMPLVIARLAGTLRSIFETAGQVTVGEGRQGIADIGGVTWGLSLGVGRAMAPVLGLMILGALAGVAIQGQTVVAVERIVPKLSKISPLAGLKRMFSATTLVDFLKNIAKVLVVGAIGLWVTYDAVSAIWQVQGVLPETILSQTRQQAMVMLGLTLVLVAAVAVADILWRRFDWRRKQRMSLQEIKDEHKETEGDPQIRARRARLRRDRSRQRIATAVPRATVVLTNPTHFAVALKYESGHDLAPSCLAKGTDLMAARIRQLARDNDIPVIENRPLARALYDVAEIDQEIPTEHWEAVAAIIGYILDLKRNIRRAPPEGSTLREDD